VRRKRKPEETVVAAPPAAASAGVVANGSSSNGVEVAAGDDTDAAPALTNGVGNHVNGDAGDETTPDAKRVKINGEA